MMVLTKSSACAAWGFGLLGAGDDRHAVAAHDNRQVRKGALYLANDLVNRAEHSDGVKLGRDGDGTCSRCHEADIPLLLVELFAGHHVRVHVEDGLAGVETGVEHQSVGAVKFLVGDVLRDGDDVGQLGRVVGGKFGDVGVVLLGHHEHVDLGLGIDVVECVGRLVLVDLAAGNLPAMILQNRQSSDSLIMLLGLMLLRTSLARGRYS